MLPSGGKLFIGNASALVLGLETVLLAAIQRTLGPGQQGDAFEFACHYIAEKLLPPTIHAFRDSYISDTMTASTGDEVDLHLHGKGIDVVIEAKSYLPTKDPAAAAASYEQLLKANKQIERRVARLREGKWMRRKRVNHGEHVSGLIVALHDYTGQVWRPESMVESEVSPFAAMPLQSFAMALGCLRSPRDLADFLNIRAAIGALQISGGDELEILLGWMSGWRANTLPREPGAKVQVRPYSIQTDDLLNARWNGVDEWRQFLFRVSEAIHN